MRRRRFPLGGGRRARLLLLAACGLLSRRRTVQRVGRFKAGGGGLRCLRCVAAAGSGAPMVWRDGHNHVLDDVRGQRGLHEGLDEARVMLALLHDVVVGVVVVVRDRRQEHFDADDEVLSPSQRACVRVCVRQREDDADAQTAQHTPEARQRPHRWCT